MQNLKNISWLILFAMCLFTLQSCYYNGNDGYNYALLNQKALYGEDYQSKRPFRLMHPVTHAPLLSREGQANLELNFAQGISGHLAIATSSKAFMFFQYDFQKGKTNTVTEDAQLLRTDGFTGDTVTIGTKFETHDEVKQKTASFGGGVYLVKKNNLRIDIFGGLSPFTGENNYLYNESYTGEKSLIEKRNGWNFFAQGDVGYVYKYFEAAVSSRFTYTAFSNQEFHLDAAVKKYEMDPNMFVIEPALKLGAGGKTFRGFFQYNFIIPVGNSDVKWMNSKLEVGVLFRFSDKVRFGDRKL